MSINKPTKGLVHIYHGDGKGKTTAAVGLSVRMLGTGGSVYFIQFLKGRTSGEIIPLKTLGATIARTNSVQKFIKNMSPEELALCKQDIARCYALFQEAVHSGAFDLVVGDEILHAVNYGFIPLNDLLQCLKEKHSRTEVVLTGRNPAQPLLEIADYVTQMDCVKHPYSAGISAREGIEY